MDYNYIVKGILDIGEAMLQSGAENYRIEDSLYRMCRSYSFVNVDVFVIPSNIQVTVETTEGEIITQIRHIENMDVDFDRLDYLNDLSRYICLKKPEEEEIRQRFETVMARKPQPSYVKYLSMAVSGGGFAVFFGGNLMDGLVAAIVSFLLVPLGAWFSKREPNLMIYNLVLSFFAESMILVATGAGIGSHPERIMIGIVMLLISGLSTTNGIRELLQKDYISGAINIMNSIFGAAGVACGTALSMLLFHYTEVEGSSLNQSVGMQLVSCTIACVGFALLFKIRGKQVVFSGLGAFLTWSIYVVVYRVRPSGFVATLIAATFVALYAYVMSRVNKAPSTIFLTASMLPLIPGSNLFYMMYGYTSGDMVMGRTQMLALLGACFAIAFGFNVVDTITRGITVAVNEKRVLTNKK